MFGPVHFLFDINNLAMRAFSQLHLFADDTILDGFITASEDYNFASWPPEARRVGFPLSPQQVQFPD